MNPAITAARFAAAAAVLAGLIARHGHLRRLAGPLLVLIWQRVTGINAQVAALLVRMQAGTLRRYPARCPPPPAAAPRRRPAHGMLPSGHGWLVRLIPEAAVSGAHLQHLLADPDIPALLQAAPQLRRALRPLCRMLGVRLPTHAPKPLASDPDPLPPPLAGAPGSTPEAAQSAPARRIMAKPPPRPGPLRP